MTKADFNPTLSSRYLHALQFAGHIHADQRRKGIGTPYLSHLMAVSALVLDFGGTEDQAIGGLLHDAAEDCGGRPMLERVRATFGPDVATIVEGCTDTFDDGGVRFFVCEALGDFSTVRPAEGPSRP
ncbi:MAG: HD domain-containing protein [Rhodocyclales bacterium]|nr:HD domain-containing protein [Rhodocyclales bacterium]